MCNLYSQTTAQEAMRRLFNAEDRLGNQPALPAIFPDGEAPVCRRDKDGARELVRMRWGFPKVRASYVTNARNMSSNYWRGWFGKPEFRCLVPASSFAEYHPTEKDEKGRKLASWFVLKGDEPRPPFAFAGLWRPWTGERKKGEEGEFNLYAFLTCEPNEVVAPIHPKAMPVILEPDDYDTWLTAPADEALKLQRPFPAEKMYLAFTGKKKDTAEAQ